MRTSLFLVCVAAALLLTGFMVGAVVRATSEPTVALALPPEPLAACQEDARDLAEFNLAGAPDYEGLRLEIGVCDVLRYPTHHIWMCEVIRDGELYGLMQLNRFNCL